MLRLRAVSADGFLPATTGNSKKPAKKSLADFVRFVKRLLPGLITACTKREIKSTDPRVACDGLHSAKEDAADDESDQNCKVSCSVRSYSFDDFSSIRRS